MGGCTSKQQRNNTEEYEYWLSKVKDEDSMKKYAWDANRRLDDENMESNRRWKCLKDAPHSIRNDERIILAAIDYDIDYGGINDGYQALQYATPILRNNKTFMLKVIQESNGDALRYASPELQNDKAVVMAAVKKEGKALEHASPELQNDKQVVMAAIQETHWSLRFASPSLQNDKDFILQLVQKNGFALACAPSKLQDDKEVVMAAIGNRKYGVLEHASPRLRNDKEVVMAALKQSGRYSDSVLKHVSIDILHNDKDIALLYVQHNPNNIKFINEELKRDSDILVAAGMFDGNHHNNNNNSDNNDPDLVFKAGHHHQHQEQQRQPQPIMTKMATTQSYTGGGDNNDDVDVSSRKKIVLSTRFSLDQDSNSEATNFTKLLKQHPYIIQSDFKVYAPNAFDKNTCDPQWTDINHPCRGTFQTCNYNNILTSEGHPTDDCCWRFSFRSQLLEAKLTGGFMLQLIEKSGGNDQELGKGQQIEREMASDLDVKIFHVYRPMFKLGHEYTFNKYNIDEVGTAIKEWYDDDCWDMSECPILPSPHLK